MKLIIPTLLACAWTGLGGCGQDLPATLGATTHDLAPRPALTIHTRLEPAQVLAGQTSAVLCSAWSDQGRVALDGWTLELFGADLDATLAPGGGALSGTSAGRYPVACVSPAGQRDDSPARLAVLQGPAVTVRTLLATDTAEAGVPVSVDCRFADSFGNEADQAWWLAVDEGLSYDLPLVWAERPGAYVVRCQGQAVSDAQGALLTVSPGQPYRVSASATPGTITVGDQGGVQLGCAVWDACGNPLPAAPTVLEIVALEAADAAGLFVTADRRLWGTAAGAVLVFCAVPGSRAGDESPALVTLLPGPPVYFEVEPDALTCQARHRPLPLQITASDAYGNVLADPPLRYRSEPADGLSLANGRPTYTADGEYTLRLELDGASQTLTASVAVQVDQSAPEVVLWPGRGSWLLGSAASPVQVSATVSDQPAGLASVLFDGQSFDPTAGPLYAWDKPARWGLNTVTGLVADRCSNRRQLVSSFLRAEGYAPPATASWAASRVRDGLVLHLGQEVVDDGVRGSASDPSELDDLASLAEVILAAFDLNALMDSSPAFVDPWSGNRATCQGPDPDSSWPDRVWLKKREPCAGYGCIWPLPDQVNYGSGYGVRKHGALTMEPLRVAFLRAVNGGLALSAQVGNNDGAASLYLPLRVYGDVDLGCLGEVNLAVSGYLQVDQLTVTGTLAVSLAGGQPVVSMPTPDVGLDDLYVYVQLFGNATLDGWLSGIVSWIAGWFEGYIEDTIAGILADELPPLVRDFLASVSIATSFTLPPPLAMTLNLDTQLASLSFVGPPGSGWGRFGFDSQLYPSTFGAGGDPTLGAPLRAGAAPSFADRLPALGAGLLDDFLNQVLWAVWYGGALRLTDLGSLTGELGFDGVSLALDALLPPVLMPGAAPGTVEIGLGDARVRARLDLASLLGQPGLGALELDLYVSALLGGQLGVTDGALTIALLDDPPPLVQVEVLSVNGSQADVATYSQLFAGIFGQVLPALVADMLSAIPLPAIDLGGLGVPGVPPGASLRIADPQLDRPSDHATRLWGGVVME